MLPFVLAVHVFIHFFKLALAALAALLRLSACLYSVVVSERRRARGRKPTGVSLLGLAVHLNTLVSLRWDWFDYRLSKKQPIHLSPLSRSFFITI